MESSSLSWKVMETTFGRLVIDVKSKTKQNRDKQLNCAKGTHFREDQILSVEKSLVKKYPKKKNS